MNVRTVYQTDLLDASRYLAFITVGGYFEEVLYHSLCLAGFPLLRKQTRISRDRHRRWDCITLLRILLAAGNLEVERKALSFPRVGIAL